LCQTCLSRDHQTLVGRKGRDEFKSVMSQTLAVLQVLPLEVAGGLAGASAPVSQDYIYEQEPVAMLEQLIPRYVEVAVFRALLETVASWQAARMTAMDTASSNAQDVIEALTLHMNRVRQAAITKEIIEVVSGAAAAE
jgi:F-type H+-transporting ATPase subunit gamma